MPSKSANEKHYFVTLKDEEVNEMGQWLVDKKATVRSWIQGKENEVEEYIIEEYHPAEKCLTMTSQKGVISGLIKSRNVGKDMFFALGNNERSYFTTAVLEHDDGNGEYFILINKSVFRSQQRTDYRLKPSKYVALKCLIEDKEYPVADLSASGMAINIKESEKETFSKGATFQDNLITLNNFSYQIPVIEVVSQKEETNPDNTFLVGVQFQGLDSQIEDQISQVIHACAREEEARNMLRQAAELKKDKE